jgi:uncharacterized protein YecT (DUF1311 family)
VRLPIALALACVTSATTAGVLQDCKSTSADPSRILACLRQAREAATDEMLEQFLGVEQTIAKLGEGESALASGALKQSQRAFERYVLEHCHGLQGPLAGEAASLACEIELLRQRGGTLEALEVAADRI